MKPYDWSVVDPEGPRDFLDTNPPADIMAAYMLGWEECEAAARRRALPDTPRFPRLTLVILALLLAAGLGIAWSVWR